MPNKRPAAVVAAHRSIAGKVAVVVAAKRAVDKAAVGQVVAKADFLGAPVVVKGAAVSLVDPAVAKVAVDFPVVMGEVVVVVRAGVVLVAADPEVVALAVVEVFKVAVVA